jgi:hypothetical protein
MELNVKSVCASSISTAPGRSAVSQSRGGYAVLKRILTEKTPIRNDHRRGEEVRPAWARRRRLSHRAEVELHQPQRARAALHRLQLRRGRARHLQGPRHSALQPPSVGGGDDHRRLYHRRRAGYNYIRGEFWEPYERFEAAIARPVPPGCWARTSSAPGSISSCTATSGQAPMSAARRRRCWSPSRARRDSRASSRRSRRISVCTAGRRSSTTPSPWPPSR